MMRLLKQREKAVDFQKELIEQLDRLTHQVVQLKSSLVYQVKLDPREGDRAWQDLMEASEASKEVSAKWSGYTALEEIQAQREV
jgi:hypothetical protein